MQLIVTTPFGLEAVVRRELKDLGYEGPTVTDGRLQLTGDAEAICRCNLWLRSAERVLWEIGRFSATDFGLLFDRTRELPWADILPRGARFPIRARSVRSQLHHTPSIQSLVKKAIVEAIRPAGSQGQIEETGPEYAVDVSILKDEVSLTLDTTGPGLHKRGYRTSVGRSPLKETLAAALVQLSFWKPGRPFHDPCCGTGTIPIEAALIALNRAPGRHRRFAAENWPNIKVETWERARQEADDLQLPPNTDDLKFIGTDIDRRSLGMARLHANNAQVESLIHFQEQPLAAFSSSRPYGCIITNPPYGVRAGAAEDLLAVYGELPRIMQEHETWSYYILSAFSEYQQHVTRPPDRRRKLYNGRIECVYYQYFGPRPPR